MKPTDGEPDGEGVSRIPPEFQEFLPSFIASAREHIDAIDQGLLKLEKNPNAKDAAVNIARNAHSLKGAAMTIGISEMAHLCHTMEDLMEEIRDERIPAESKVFDALFQANDANKAVLEDLAASSTVSVDIDAAVHCMEEIICSEGGLPDTPSGNTKPHKTASIPSTNRISYDSVRVSTKKVDRFLNIAVEMVITRNRIQSFREQLDELEEVQTKQRSRLSLLVKDIENSSTGMPYPAAPLKELLQSQQQGEKRLEQFSEGFHETVERLSHLVDETQQLVMDIRMLPVSLLFNPFSRYVRDLSHEKKKSIDLVIKGEKTLIDKRAIEELSDPLLHLIRNAIDHGMDSVLDRKAAHKDERGKITLRAFQGIDKTIIEVIDDGPGIDKDRIKQKALEKKILTEEESKHMLDDEVFDLLFLPGFSTAEMVTELSGRGVGMDVVKTNVEKLNGSVEISTTVGKGTIVRIALPLTLATAKAFLVRCSEHILAIPIFSAIQVLRLSRENIQTIKGREAVYWQGEIIPGARLDATLSLPEVPTEESHGKTPLLLLRHGGKKIAFQVDEVIGVEQIVMRNLGTHLGRLPVFSGSSILGTGEIALIIDVARLFTMAQIKAGNLFLERNMPETPSDTRQRILLVEDQITTRLLEKSILEAAGFWVETAENGTDALGKLEGAPFHLVITDVQMPKMDGFTLTSTLKKDSRFSHIPVIIVTSLEREEERKQGLLAGADAFLLKKSFNQESLIHTIRTLIG